jgi:transposase
MRRLVARRNQVVRHRTQIKNEVHSILHAHLVPRCPRADLFGRLGGLDLTFYPYLQAATVGATDPRAYLGLIANAGLIPASLGVSA